MKRLLGSIAGALAALAVLPAAALAAPITFTDVKGPGLHQCVSAWATMCLGGAPAVGSTTLYLDILDTSFAPNSVITEATLTLTLADDGGPGDGSEKMDLTLDGNTVQSNANVNHNVVVEFTDFGALSDGQLTVQIIGRSGDFFVEGALLELVAEAPTVQQQGTVGSEQQAGPSASQAAVPAPAAIVILGAGLLGLGWKRRISR